MAIRLVNHGKQLHTMSKSQELILVDSGSEGNIVVHHLADVREVSDVHLETRGWRRWSPPPMTWGGFFCCLRWAFRVQSMC
jgi:hypothetical protein